MPEVRVQNGHAAADPSYGAGLLVSPDVEQVAGFSLRIVETVALTRAEMRTELQRETARVRERVAQDFADEARAVGGVTEIWASTDPESVVTVITETHDLERELRLQAIFRGVTAAHEIGFEADIDVYAESDGVPGWARAGRQLFP